MASFSSQTDWRTDFEEPIAVWNSSPALRLGVPLVILEFVWSLVAPTEPTSLAMTMVDTLFSAIFVIGIVSLLTGLVTLREWDSDDKLSQSRWQPLKRFELNIFKSSREQTSRPRRPHGYQPPYDRSGGSVILPLIFGFIWTIPLLWLLYQTGQAATALWGTPAIVGDTDWIFIGTVIVATVAVHELIHALVAAFCGCQISIGVVVPLAAYIRPSGALLSRNERICIAIAPTIAITVITSILIFHTDGWVVPAAFLALLVNTSGAGSDFYSIWQLLKAPSKRLYYIFPDRDRPLLVFDYYSQRGGITLLERCEQVIVILTTRLKIKPARRN